MPIGGGIRRKIKALFHTPAQKRHAMVGPAELWKMKRDFQFDYLTGVGLMPSHYLADIGCGTLRGGIPLIGYLNKGHYYGVESREDVLVEGRKELSEANLTDKAPVLLASDDISSLNVEQWFDFVWAFSVLIHLSDHILENTMGFVANHLADTGAFLANVNLGEAPEGNWQGFPVVHRPLHFYQDAAARFGMMVEDVGSLQQLGHQSGDQAQDRQRMLRVTRA